MRTSFTALLLLSAAVALPPLATTAAPETAPPPRKKYLSEQDIQRYIEQLGSDGFEEREEATEALKRRPEAAIALLRANRTSTIPEVRRRLATILPVMMSRDVAEKRLDRLPEYVKKRQLDRIVETMVACREFIRPQDDRAIHSFVKDLYESATGGKLHLGTSRHFPEFNSFSLRSQLGGVNEGTLVAERARDGARGMIVSNSIHANLDIDRSVVLCNGSVVLPQGGIGASFVVATGNVDVVHVDQAFVACPGNFDFGGGHGCVIVTGGRIRSCGDEKLPEDRSSVLREADREFFKTWDLLTAEQLGAKSRSLFGAVVLGQVRPGSLFANRGLRSGDIVQHINGQRIDSASDFVRFLCRVSVTWGVADIEILRGNKTLLATLTFDP